MDLLLALLGGDDGVREVRLARRASNDLSTRISAFADRFLNNDTEEHAYAPGFRPDEDGVLVLPLTLPDVLWRCRATLPNDVRALDSATLRDQPPIALVSVDTGHRPRFIFQVVDNRNMLREGRAIFFNPGGFAFSDHPGVIVPDRVDAIHKGGRLYFRSESTVRRFLDIGDVFREATDQEIEDLFAADTFAVDDLPALKAAASMPLRRKLHAVLQGGRAFSTHRLRTVAQRLNIPLTIRGNAVVVPTERRELRNFVRLLADDFLRSMLDEETVYLTTSKKPVD